MRLASSVLVVLAAAGAVGQTALGSAFTDQGRRTDASVPATGRLDDAERFRGSDDVERGERVAEDESRPAFVHRARGESHAAVLGVTSMDPALLIGGTTFEVGAPDAGSAELAQELRASP